MSASPRTKRAAETRARIIEATSVLLQDKLASEFTLTNVADAAGVSPALIILHFGSKEGLIFRSIMEGMRSVGNPLLEAQWAAGAFKTLNDLIVFVLQRDISNAPRTREALAHSWKLTPAEEDLYWETVETRISLGRKLIANELWPDPPAVVVEEFSWIATTVYNEVLRTALALETTAEEALAAFDARFSPMLALVKAQGPERAAALFNAPRPPPLGARRPRPAGPRGAAGSTV